jgi:putative oxidoreductase
MRIFSTAILELNANLCLLFTRIIIGAFTLSHGLPKLYQFTSGQEIKFADPLGFGPEVSMGLVVFAEVGCAILIILGFGTRLASIPLMINMGVAAFMAHANDPFGTKEKPLLFLIIFIILFVFGSGKYSIDRLIAK